MTSPSDSLPHAHVTARRHISPIWLIPLVAIAIGGWLAWDTISKQGPTITITFDTAEGLQAGQSQLKYKEIVFGTVKKLELTPDKWHVIVTVETTRAAEPLLTDKTVFWVVKPRLFAGNVSGLDTVLSGSYIGMIPSEAAGDKKHEFIGQEDPPILEAHVPGRVFLLKSPRIGSVSVGSPLFFRDIAVGEVLGWDVSQMAENVTIRAFVRAPFDKYVSDETRFWNASGLSLKLGGTGISLRMESLRALLFGGIAFDTPALDTKTEAAAQDHEFPLFADRDAANSASYARVISAVSYFGGSVKGLGAGSDVTMQGLKVGEVTHVRLIARRPKGDIVAKVRYELQPQRVALLDDQQKYKTDAELVSAMLNRGLRASLVSASLITGQQEVSLQFVPDASATALSMDENRFILPVTESGGLAALAASAGDLLKQVDTIPFSQIGANLNGILGSVNKATEGPDMKNAVADLTAALAAARRTLVNADKLMASVDTGYGNDTKFHRDLDRLLTQTDDAVRSIRALTDLMSRHPESLIRGRPE